MENGPRSGAGELLAGGEAEWTVLVLDTYNQSDLVRVTNKIYYKVDDGGLVLGSAQHISNDPKSEEAKAHPRHQLVSTVELIIPTSASSPSRPAQ